MDRQEIDRLHRRIDEVETRIEAGDNHGAVRAAEILASEFPDHPDVLSSLARARLAAGDSDSAADACAQLLALSPEYSEAARLLEECRLVSPAESPLGSMVVRDHPSGAGAEHEPALLDPPVDPAAAVLRQRVDDLLSQARVVASHGRNEEALAVLSRLLILDERNEAALAFEEVIRGRMGTEARELDGWLSEGIQHLDQGALEEARQLFLQVLERSPGHAEALDLLERADARLAMRDLKTKTPDPLPKPAGSESGRASARRPAADAERPPDAIPAPDAGGELFDSNFEFPEEGESPEQAPETSLAPAVPAPRSRRVAMLAAAGVLLAVLGGFAAWKLFAGSGTGNQEEEATVALPKAAGARATPPGAPKQGTPASAAGVTEAERSKQLAGALGRGGASFQAGDFAEAILAYNAALALDPDNSEARQGLLASGDRYRATKAQSEQFEKARRAFAAAEYESALRMFYRLPEKAAEPATILRYKVAGWYNLGVIALRAADCGKAVDQFKEALALQPADPALREARQLADQCASQRKDRVFYDAVEALPFRNPEE